MKKWIFLVSFLGATGVHAQALLDSTAVDVVGTPAIVVGECVKNPTSKDVKKCEKNLAEAVDLLKEKNYTILKTYECKIDETESCNLEGGDEGKPLDGRVLFLR